jgi:hypothetical protein
MNKLDPFEGEYAKHFHSVDPLKCSEEEDWLSLSNGTIYIDPGIKKQHGGISCSITFFDRIDDNENVSHIPLQKDLILDGRILVCLHQK